MSSYASEVSNALSKVFPPGVDDIIFDMTGMRRKTRNVMFEMDRVWIKLFQFSGCFKPSHVKQAVQSIKNNHKQYIVQLKEVCDLLNIPFSPSVVMNYRELTWRYCSNRIMARYRYKADPTKLANSFDVVARRHNTDVYDELSVADYVMDIKEMSESQRNMTSNLDLNIAENNKHARAFERERRKLERIGWPID